MQHLNIYQRQVICFHMFQFSGFWIWWRNIGIGLVITQCHLWFILIEMTFFFLDLLCKHVFKHYYWLGPYSLFHKLCIKNPKMLHLTSHKFYFQVAGQGNVILRIPIFTTFCYAKNMMWVDFKCHKFNNSHFILVTKVTIHYHKKKKIQYLLISIPTIAATLKFMGRRNTAFHFTPETSGTYTFYWYFLHSVSRNHWD